MTHEIARFELAQEGWPNDIFPFKWAAPATARTRLFASNSGSCHTARHTTNRSYRTGKSMITYPFWQQPAKAVRLSPHLGKKMKENFRTGLIAFFRFVSLFCMTKKSTVSVLVGELFLREMAYSLTLYFITLPNIVL